MILSPIYTLELGLIVLPKNPESFSEPVWMYRSPAVLLVKRTLCRESAIARSGSSGLGLWFRQLYPKQLDKMVLLNSSY